jgi:hypothetical protein
MSHAVPFEIWDIPGIRAVKAAKPITKSTDFTAADMIEIDRLLTACCMALEGVDCKPGQIKALLTGLSNGYGCWLDVVGAAILEADLSDDDRNLLYGSFSMVKAWLFDIQGYNRC